MNEPTEVLPSAVTLTDAGASMRRIHPRSSISNRGFVIAPVPGQPNRRKRIHFESRLEQKVIYLLLARRDVLDVVEQQKIRLPNGAVTTSHTLDLLAQLRDGSRVGILVKPWKYATSDRMRAQVAALQRHAVPYHADRFIVITDADFTSVQVRNAELLHLARNSPDPEADDAIREFAQALNGDIRIDHLASATCLGKRAFRAVIRAIGAGVLQPVTAGLIDLHAAVRKGEF